MSTENNAKAIPTKGYSTKKAKFTVADAARAFRIARGDTRKVEFGVEPGQTLRRNEAGFFVLVSRSSPGGGAGAAKRAAAERAASKRAVPEAIAARGTGNKATAIESAGATAGAGEMTGIKATKRTGTKPARAKKPTGQPAAP